MSDILAPWWRTAVGYQVYVRSFADADGDGIGDLPGLRGRLPYLRDLGVDALWLTPFYPSPQEDHGYDVADHTDVDPLFGTLDDADALIADSHALGLKLVVDVVPNHTSSAHPWFQAALAAAAGSPERDRYLFRDGRGPGGDEPPNNWLSSFGGSAWSRVPDGQWYLHLYATGQPDLNWRNPEVGDDFGRVLRFWLDRGADGVRIDVAHGLVKDQALRDNPGVRDFTRFGIGDELRHSYDQPEVHDVYRRWRRLVDAYPGDRVLIGELWVREPASFARYLRPDELHQAFAMPLVFARWQAGEVRSVVEQQLAAVGSVGASATWVLSNHDVVREVTRYGGGELGRARAAGAALLLLALPGAAWLYAGEELGLPEVDVPPAARQDPIFVRGAGARPGRDGCRVPLPWSGDGSPFGFSAEGVAPWLPQPGWFGELTVARQAVDPGSMLTLYRRALQVRRATADLSGPAAAPLAWVDAPPDVLDLRRGRVRCRLNMAETAVPLPAGQLLVASADVAGGQLPPGAAAWVREAG